MLYLTSRLTRFAPKASCSGSFPICYYYSSSRAAVLHQIHSENIVGRPISTSSVLCKIRKGLKKEKLQHKNALDINSLNASVDKEKLLNFVDDDENNTDGERPEATRMQSEILALKGLKEMKDRYNTLVTNIDKHMTLNLNLKAYEEMVITLDSGEPHKLYKFARIRMRDPSTIELNFADNPAAIKPTRRALEAIGDKMNVHQNGVILYVPVPKITRERREELANKVSAAIIYEFRLALNQLFSKYSKEIERSSKTRDETVRLNNGLLVEKNKLIALGDERIKERKGTLLKEIL